MARTKISEFSATPNDNTDIDGIDIAEGCAPSGINNAIRELMSQLKDMQTGASGDTFTLTTVNSTTVDTTNLEATNLKAKDGTAAGSIADSTGVVTLGSSVLTTTDINGGTVDGTTIGASVPSTVVATQVDITAQGDLRLQDTTGGQYVALQAPGTVATSYTLTLPVDDGTAGQALITDGSGVLSWSSAASGDVYGPGSATDNAVARYDGTTGKIIQNSAVTIGDDGATVIAANSSSDGLRITQIGAGNALLVEDSANPDATPFVVDADGKVFVGQLAGTTTYLGTSAGLQINEGAGIAQSINKFTNNANGGNLVFAKGRGSYSVNTSVVSGDRLGSTYWTGADGTGYIPAASILAEVDGTPGTNDMPGRLVFSTTADGASSPTERMRIGNAGGVGIGTTSVTDRNLGIGKNITGATAAYGVVNNGQIQSDVTNLSQYYRTTASTAAASFTLTTLDHFSANQGTIGAGSAVTSQVGFNATASLTGATNNYGFYGNIASGTGRWNLYMAGTAANYLEGDVGIGVTGGEKLAVAVSNPTDGRVASLRNNGSSALTGTKLRFLQNTVGDWNIGQPAGVADFVFCASASSTSERMRITNAGTISLGAAPGAESLRVTPVASAVNYWNFIGGATGTAIGLAAIGSDTNVSLGITTKGNGVSDFYSNNYGSLQFRIAHTASAVNYLQVRGEATGNRPVFEATGSDANVGIYLTTKGTGSYEFHTGGARQFSITNTSSAVNYLQVTGGDGTTNSPRFIASGSSADISVQLLTKGTGNFSVMNDASATQFRVAPTASAVNYFQVTGGATGSPPYLLANGSDTDVSASYYTKGVGAHYFRTNQNPTQFVVAHTASAVNYLQVTGAATGQGALLQSAGSDTNIAMVLGSKGSGAIFLATSRDTGFFAQFAAVHTASAVNYVVVTGSATGNSVTVGAQGSDTNIDIALTPKGTGVLKFGTYTAGVVTQAGYITIKDAAGNTRRLLVG